MKRVNYHTHTSYCRHAKGTVAEYAQEARKSGLEVLGFSDHIPYPGNPFGPFHQQITGQITILIPGMDIHKNQIRMGDSLGGEGTV